MIHRLAILEMGLVVLFPWSLVWPVHQAYGAEPIHVMVIGDDAQDEQRDQATIQLWTAIKAHLSVYPTRVTLIRDDGDPRAAVHASIEQGAQVVVWLTDDDRLALFVPAQDGDPRYRPIPASDEGWASRCDLIATMVLSEIDPLLTGKVRLEQPVTQPVDQPVVQPVVQPVPPPAADEPADVMATQTSSIPSLWIGVSYLPVVMSTDGPYVSGLGLHAALIINRTVQIDLSADIVQPASFELAEGTGSLNRLPIRAGATLRYPLGGVDIGLAAAVIAEVWRVQAVGDQPVDPNTTDRSVAGGAMVAAHVHFKPTPWLSPFVVVGVDLYSMRIGIGVGEQELLHRPKAMLRAAVGAKVGGPIQK